MGIGWVNLLACVVVGWICCALSYVSTFLGTCVMSGLGSTVSGAPNYDVYYPDAEAYVAAEKAAQAAQSAPPVAPPLPGPTDPPPSA